MNFALEMPEGLVHPRFIPPAEPLLRRSRNLRVACHEIGFAARGLEGAMVDGDALGIEDAEGFVGFDGDVFQDDVAGGGFGEAPDEAGSAAGGGGGGDVAEGDVTIDRRAVGEGLGGILCCDGGGDVG